MRAGDLKVGKTSACTDRRRVLHEREYTYMSCVTAEFVDMSQTVHVVSIELVTMYAGLIVDQSKEVRGAGRSLNGFYEDKVSPQIACNCRLICLHLSTRTFRPSYVTPVLPVQRTNCLSLQTGQSGPTTAKNR